MKILVGTIIFIGFDLVVALRSETDAPKLSPRSNQRSTYPEVKDRGISVTKPRSTRKSNLESPRASKAIAPPDVSVEQSDSGINYTTEDETSARNQDSVETLKTGVNNPGAIKPRESSPTTKKNAFLQVLRKVDERRKKHFPGKIEEGVGRNPFRWKNRLRNKSKTSLKYRARIFDRKKKSSRISELKIVPGKGWTASYRYSGKGSGGEHESKKNVSRNLNYSVNRKGAFPGLKRGGKSIQKIFRRIFGKKSDSSRRQFSKPGRSRFCRNNK